MRSWLLSRAPAVATFAVLGIGFSLTGRFAPGDDVAALAQHLGRAAAPLGGAVVHGEDVRWEPSGGPVQDALMGRFVLFLGAPKEGEPRDVYRARVRTSPEGHVLTVVSAHNLTQTALGDDHALVVNGARAAFATRALGAEQSVTVLALDGEGAQNVTEKRLDRLMASFTNRQQTGSAEGIARWDGSFEEAPDAVGLTLETNALVVNLKRGTATQTLQVPLQPGTAEGAVASIAGLPVEPKKHLPKLLAHWAVDTVRAVPWIGPAPIAWLEEKVFALKDAFKRRAYQATGEEAVVKQEVVALLDGAAAAKDDGSWPPKDLPSLWKTQEAGEGKWVEPKQSAWLAKFPVPAGISEAAPSTFYTTFVRPDEERSYAKVLLVAMDTRQIDLNMEAGSEDPKPLTGPPGKGRLPREPEVYTRVVAAFNGGFKTEHGNYGMMVDKRLLLPPQPGAATVVLLNSGRFGLGSWGDTTKVSGLIDIPDGDIRSFRQNLDPLVDQGVVNPSGRALWGFTLPGTGMQTERSGICVTEGGHFLYAWGDDVSAITLGKAMKLAGCTYGMHLDMNPHHTGLLFTNIQDISKKAYKAELLSNQMEIGTDRYIQYAPKDFFYVMLRRPEPPVLTTGGAAWAPATGVQPAPTWFPALWETQTKSGLKLLAWEAGRGTFRLRAGTAEPGKQAPEIAELTAEDAAKVLLAAPLGSAEGSRVTPLVVDGKRLFSGVVPAGHALLVVAADGTVSLDAKAALDGLPAGASAIDVPLLIDDGKPLAPAETATAALGLCAGRMVLAHGDRARPASEFAEALVAAGCEKAALLRRGRDAGAPIERGAVKAKHPESTLFVIAAPMKPRAFTFRPEKPVEYKKKK